MVPWSIVLTCCFLAGPPAGAPVGYLGGEPYRPAEGDLIFYDDRHPLWGLLFLRAGSGPPLHMGIVVRRPGGELAVLEAGPDDTVWVARLEVATRLRRFHNATRGAITVRRCRVALAAERSAALTRFAAAQDGKRYAVLRLLAQGTPFRARGPFGTAFAATHLDRDAWFCSELAVAAGTVAGLFDPRSIRANTVYPRDLVTDRRHDLSPTWHPAARWTPELRAR